MSEAEKCRLVLVTPGEAAGQSVVDATLMAIAGGDIASIIVPQYAMDEEAYQSHLMAIASGAQAAGIAVIAAGDVRMAARAGVDGIHASGGASEVAHITEQYRDTWIVGANGGTTRHGALEMGEAWPDYMFFGKLGGDTHEMPHKKAIELATWWAEFVEIPAILLGGNSLATLADSARTGVEFVALSRAIFDHVDGPKAAVEAANAVLAEYELEIAE